jgi:FkbM family methyltransferase
MLLDFNALFKKYNMQVRGVLQVGAHRGQEDGLYERHGIKKRIYVEPSSLNFKILGSKFGDDPDVMLINVACGEKKERLCAILDTTNQGMSSSLLSPKEHLKQHPDVIFNDSEMWNVERLDDIPFDREQYNLLNIDVQGFEDRVFRGAPETLKHIDYIFAEVNREEIYETCARVEQLDEMLSDFVRVETGWASENHGWGDACYVRKSWL